MTITARTIEVGDVVQIKHSGLPDWITIEVLTLPSIINRTGGREPTSGIKVRYIDMPDYLFNSSVVDMDTYTGYQWNIYETKFRPAPVQPLTNEEILKIFLKKHKVLTVFKTNLRNTNIREDYIGSKGSTEVHLVLLDAFQWGGSIKGSSTWRDLNTKWEKLCKDFNLKGRVCMKKFLKL